LFCCAALSLKKVNSEGDKDEWLSFPKARSVPMPPVPGNKRLNQPIAVEESPGKRA
jgi:hypothetical protein